MPPGMPNSNRILLVEDNRDSLEALFTALIRQGYSVLTADNGQQALDLLEHGIAPRLMILDLMLPKVSGWEVLKYLQSDAALRHIPVIVVTAVSPHETTVVADAVIHKPLDHKLLLSTVARLIGPPPDVSS
jgi:CheY-like chemotaxis protein